MRSMTGLLLVAGFSVFAACSKGSQPAADDSGRHTQIAGRGGQAAGRNHLREHRHLVERVAHGAELIVAITAKEFFSCALLYIEPQSRKFDAPQH